MNFFEKLIPAQKLCQEFRSKNNPKIQDSLNTFETCLHELALFIVEENLDGVFKSLLTIKKIVSELESAHRNVSMFKFGLAGKLGCSTRKNLADKLYRFVNTFESSISPLTWSALKGRRNFIYEFFDNPNRNIFPLIHAVQDGHADIVRLLLDKDVDLGQTHKETGIFPLSLAALKGYTDIIRLLLEKGANSNQVQEKECMTPLAYAVYNGHADSVQLLLEHNAQVDFYSKTEQKSIMDYAIKSKRKTKDIIINMLKEYQVKQALSNKVYSQNDINFKKISVDTEQKIEEKKSINIRYNP